MFNKFAKILSTLQPHQESAVQRALANNMVFAHSTGSGKTLTSIALADRLNAPTTVLTPASLVDNYQKELKKHKKGGPSVEVISLPTALRHEYQIPKGNTVIIDEAHALRNSGSERYRYVDKQLDNAGRVIALTGTPAYNQPGDWAPLLNLVSRKRLLPETTQKFNQKYISVIDKQPNWFLRTFWGVPSGKEYKLKDANRLRNKLHPYIDVFEADIEKPKRIDTRVEVTLDPLQENIDTLVKGQGHTELIPQLRPNKQNANLNPFLIGERQIANSPAAFMSDVEEGAKIRKAVEILRDRYKKNKNLRALVYSNFRQSGVDSMASLLDKEKIPYSIFHGGLNSKKKRQIVENFNSGKLPVILGTSSASEGLDLKKTQLIQLLEPHFNEARIDQVIGRGIRYKSHEGLPKDQQKVEVQRFYSMHPKTFTQKLLGLSATPTIDASLSTHAKSKEELIQALKKVLQ